MNKQEEKQLVTNSESIFNSDKMNKIRNFDIGNNKHIIDQIKIKLFEN